MFVVRVALVLGCLAPLGSTASAEPWHAQPPSARASLGAVRATHPPAIDGSVEDDVWADALTSDAFTQKFPDEGTAPSERTVMRVLYDDDAVYVAFQCEQRLAPVARLTRRDRDVEADYVRLSIDSRGGGTNAFEFSINAAGVLTDSIRFNDTEVSREWDEVWEGKARATATGWSAEFRIPLRVLRFAARPVQTWGFQGARYISGRKEIDEWSFIPRSAGGEVSHYGALTGLLNLKPRRWLTLRPFVTGGVRRRDPDPAVASSGTSPTGSGGLDLTWNITQELILTSTLNPDFGQVEADQVTLNLTSYELQFPEKRPFFLAEMDGFATPFKLLYTRRIGLAPTAPAVRSLDGEQVFERPGPTTIYNASKLVGSLGERWSVSSLAAITASNRVDAVLASGAREDRLVEPLAVFGVVRLKRSFSNAHLGVVATSTTRAHESGFPEVDGPDGGRQRLCPNGRLVELGRRCFADGYVGGIDGRWRSPSGEYAVLAQSIGTVSVDGPPRHLADGTVIDSGDVGHASLLSIAKEGGKRWAGELYGDVHTRTVDYNQLGFMKRQNLARAIAFVEYRTLEPWWAALETRTSIYAAVMRNLDGLNVGDFARLASTWTLPNFWKLAASVELHPTYYDDREIRDGSALERSGYGGVIGTVSTDPRRWITATLTSTSQLRDNGLLLGVEGELSMRPLPQFELQLLPAQLVSRGEPRLVGRGASPGELLFGDLDARNISMTFRTTYSFTPQASLQLYAQLFLAYGSYTNFRSFRPAAGSTRPIIARSSLTPGGAPMEDPDFQNGSLNLNAVLRWEWAPGSTLFVVYTRAQTPRDPLATGQTATLDFPSVYRGRADDMALVKVAYFLD